MLLALPAQGAALSEREQFSAMLSDLQEKLPRLETQTASPAYHRIFLSSCQPRGDSAFESAIQREQARMLEQDRGLELRGGYRSASTASSEEDDSSLTGGRANLELSWDVLKNGYLQNASKAEFYRIRAKEANVLADMEQRERHFRCVHLAIKQQFSALLEKHLQTQVEFLEEVYKVERRAYFKHWSYLDDYLVSERDLALTRRQLQNLLADPFYDTAPLFSSLPPPLSVDLAEILSRIRQDRQSMTLFNIRRHLLTAEDRQYHDSLRVYLRREFTDATATSDEDEFIAGLRFRIPLHTRDSNLLDLRRDRLARQQQQYTLQRLTRTRSSFWLLQEQLQQTIEQRYRYQRARERVRRTLLQIRRGEERLLTAAVTRMKSALAARYELLRAMEQLYSRINAVFEMAQIAYDASLVEPVVLQPHLQRGRPGKRSLYIWSDDFNRTSNEELLAFLEAKSISTVLLSAGRKTDKEKLASFLPHLDRYHIEAELIVGDNTWIFPEKHKLALERSLQAAETTGRLHLDIEPQALPDYTNHRPAYLRHYVDLLRKIKARLLDRKLTIAVPFHWPEATYRQLAGTVDRLYVMVYGTEKPETINRRMTAIGRVVPPQKLAVVINAREFTDEWAIEELLTGVAAGSGLDHFGIHDFGNFYNKTLKPYAITQ